jgi:hypothetical protein
MVHITNRWWIEHTKSQRICSFLITYNTSVGHVCILSNTRWVGKGKEKTACTHYRKPNICRVPKALCRCTKTLDKGFDECNPQQSTLCKHEPTNNSLDKPLLCARSDPRQSYDQKKTKTNWKKILGEDPTGKSRIVYGKFMRYTTGETQTRDVSPHV